MEYLTETNNALSADGYEHISVVRDISNPDLALLRQMENIVPGGSQADRILQLSITVFFAIPLHRRSD